MRNFTTEIELYLTYCESIKVLSHHTMRAYRIDMQQFVDFIKYRYPSTDTIQTIDKIVLQSYYQHLLINYAIKTIKRKMASLKALFNYLEFEDIIEINPMRKIRMNTKEPHRLPETLRLQDIHKLLVTLYELFRNAKGDRAKYNILRTIAIIELLFATGMRVGELCNLNNDAVDLDNGSVRIIGKGNKERVVYIGSEDVLNLLREYIRLKDKLGIRSETFLSNWGHSCMREDSVRRTLCKLSTAYFAGKKITPHMFRHTFASLLLEAGIDIKMIQELLGHSSILTTQIYLHLSNASIRAAVIAKHPRIGLSIPFSA